MNDDLRRHLLEGQEAGHRYALGMPRHARAGRAGSALTHHLGSSLELHDYREYQPGDDLRHIDWNVYARSDQLTIKLFREEVMPHVDIVLDGSRSMRLPDSEKARALLALAALFAMAAANASQKHRAWLLGEQVQLIANSSNEPSLWEGIDFNSSADLLNALGRAPPWRPHGIRILLSDLFWPGDPLRPLQRFADGAAIVVVVQVLAAVDVTPTVDGPIQLIDSETGHTLDLLLDRTLLTQYQDALARHQQAWHQACRQTGAFFTTLIAEEVIKTWRLDELVAVEVLRVI